jgi:DNA-binding response OmpR family regulator
MSEHVPDSPLPVVLVVQNDVLERRFKAATLRRQGLEVFEAADIAEAVTVLKKIAVDILISEIDLVDGTALARLAKEHQPKTQIVWMAALESPENHAVTVTRH